MFMLNHTRNFKFELVFTIVITMVAILTMSMAKFSTARVADRSYDAIESIHASQTFSAAPSLASYNQVENVRAQRALSLIVDSYNAVERLRNARGLSADRSYDAIEGIHASQTFSAAPSLASYDQVENLRAQRSLSLIVDSYNSIEQLRTNRELVADRSYDLIETVRLQP